MSAARILHDLKQHDCRLSLNGDELKVDAPRGFLTEDRLSILKKYKPEIVKLLRDEYQDDSDCFFEPEEKFVAEWRGIIAELSPDNRDEKALLRTAKQFLDGPFAQTAVDSGWGAIELFGLNQNAPRARLDCMGLVPTIAWASWPLSVVSIDETFAQLMNGRTGQVLRQPRQLPGAQWSVPFWEIARA